ncbi:type II toxin-antitoxin system VapB family antitoxin [Sporichthya brevicatena]|uniref:Type II toxin-antitoxin system VapB family antitoxin n=1 Tax=Sporichthya brevicatena TaxID=171442 RepID=A0ABN1HA71_9ACTN
MRRTTIELDEDLVARAKRALGLTTTRATVEEALRRVVESGEAARAERTERQLADLETMTTHVDVDVLSSDAMWR